MKVKLFNKGYANPKEVDQLKEAISTRDKEIASLRRRVTTITNDRNKFENGYNKCDKVIRNEQTMWERAPPTIADLEKRQSCDEIMKMLKKEIINSYAKRLERRRSDYIITNGGKLISTKLGQITLDPNVTIPYIQTPVSVQSPVSIQSPVSVQTSTSTQLQSIPAVSEALLEPFDVGNQLDTGDDIPRPYFNVTNLDISNIGYDKSVTLNNKNSTNNPTIYNVKLKPPYGARIIYKTGSIINNTLDNLFCGKPLAAFFVLLLLFICICLVIGLIVFINKHRNIKQLIQS